MALITISRMYGSGGSEVAERVARALGWSLLDNAFVDAVAERLGVAPAEISAREERVPSLVERIGEAMALGSPEMLPAAGDAILPPTEERILEVTRRVIEEAAARGPVVLVGRGAQSSLAERADALHAFCYAPIDALSRRAARRLGLSPQEARKVVESTNRDREQYVQKYWKRSWKAHDNYHVCVNTEWLGIDGAARLIETLAREQFGV